MPEVLVSNFQLLLQHKYSSDGMIGNIAVGWHMRRVAHLHPAGPLKHNRDMGHAKKIISIAAGKTKDSAAVSLGRRGGLKGGPARAASMTPERRKEIAQRAAKQRWANRERKAVEATADQAVATRVAVTLP